VFGYDYNPESGFFAANLAGRLAWVETYSKRGGANWSAPGGGNAWETMAFREMYSYTQAGLMAKKRLKVSGRYSPAYPVATDYLESSYTFDGEGRMTSQTYPAAHNLLDNTEVAGDTHNYGFDGMGRPVTMNSTSFNGVQTPWISGVSYNAASQPTAITTSNAQVAGESRAYNVLGQMTTLTVGGETFTYNFSATANDGRIISQSAGSETITYQYDSLNRLASASAGSWSASYGYL